jgi:hypothetical protein
MRCEVCGHLVRFHHGLKKMICPLFTYREHWNAALCVEAIGALAGTTLPLAIGVDLEEPAAYGTRKDLLQ